MSWMSRILTACVFLIVDRKQHNMYSIIGDFFLYQNSSSLVLRQYKPNTFNMAQIFIILQRIFFLYQHMYKDRNFLQLKQKSISDLKMWQLGYFLVEGASCGPRVQPAPALVEEEREPGAGPSYLPTTLPQAADQRISCLLTTLYFWLQLKIVFLS